MWTERSWRSASRPRGILSGTTTQASAGPHTLMVVAYDAAGNLEGSVINVTVAEDTDNVPFTGDAARAGGDQGERAAGVKRSPADIRAGGRGDRANQ